MANVVTSPRPQSPVELQALISAERNGTPFLVYRDRVGDQLIRVLEREPGTMTVGRAASADLTLEWDHEVSAVHAELVAIGPEWAAVDDGLSTNGTFVNQRRIVGRQRLNNGDIVRVGSTSLTFRHPGQEPTAKTIPAGLPAIEALSPSQRRVLTALCRPLRDADRFSPPATNQQIADEISLSVEAVKTHLRAMYRRFDLQDLQQNQKRAKLAEIALQRGIVTPRDL